MNTNEGLDLLKQQAKELGITHSPNIGIEALQQKILDATNIQSSTEIRLVDGWLDKVKHLIASPEQVKIIKKKQAEKLVRVRVTCMNPAKSTMEGDIFTVRNKLTGDIKRYIPFNAEAWHIPQIMLDMLKEKEYTHHYQVKGPDGTPVTKSKQMKEYNIEILPSLTKEELQELAKEQLATGRIANA
jgi:hypothetical protein